jgi:hypothetical protein
MSIVKIEGTNVYKTSLAPNIDIKEFLANNKDYIETDLIIDSNNVYVYKNGIIKIDFEATKERKIILNKEKASFLLPLTDYLILADDPISMNQEERMSVIEYRALLRKVSDILPFMPDFLELRANNKIYRKKVI